MNLTAAILKALKNVDPYLVPEAALVVDVNALQARPSTLSEIRQALADLEAKGHVVGLNSEDSRKWRLTDNGRAEILARGL